MLKPIFADGKKKAVTFSYDDGITQDRRLVEIFNKYGMKCTFNLNSGKFGIEAPANGFNKPVSHNKIAAAEVAELYIGHEVAVHTLTHPRLQYLSKDTIRDEILEDRKNLEALVKYPVSGMAYPFGTYNDLVLAVMRECGIKYSRTVEQTKTFGYPQDFLRWHPTVHFGDENMDFLTNKFLNLENESTSGSLLPIYYIWGHSYELDGNDSWEQMENLCNKLSNDANTWFATNGELVTYYEALKACTYSADEMHVKNNSAISLWFEIDGKPCEVKPGEYI